MDTKLMSLLDAIIKDSIGKYISENNENSLGDLYLHFDADSAILFVYDDVERLLNELQLGKEQASITDNFEDQLRNALHSVLQQLEEKHFFDKPYIFKPFTVSMVDENFVVTDELIFIDDDTLKLDGDLLTNLDQDLDDFLKQLMK